MMTFRRVAILWLLSLCPTVMPALLLLRHPSPSVCTSCSDLHVPIGCNCQHGHPTTHFPPLAR